MRKRNCKKVKFKIRYIFFAFLVVLYFLAIGIIEKSLQPKIKDICWVACKAHLAEIISDSIMEVIEINNLRYNDIVLKSLDNNKISAIDIKTENVNSIQAAVIKTIRLKLEKNEYNTISVSLGNISDYYFLLGKGPEIKVRLSPEAVIEANVKSEFRTAGINQTCHRIIINVKGELVAVLPDGNINISVNQDFLLAESIIVGNVPDGFIG